MREAVDLGRKPEGKPCWWGGPASAPRGLRTSGASGLARWSRSAAAQRRSR